MLRSWRDAPIPVRMAVAVVGTVLLLALVAAGSGAFRSDPGAAAEGDSTWLTSGLGIAAALIVGVIVPLWALFVLAGDPRRTGRRAGSGARRKMTTLGILTVIALVFLAHFLREDDKARRKPIPPGQVLTQPRRAPADDGPRPHLEWTAIAAAGAVGAALAAAVLARRARHAQLESDDASEDAPDPVGEAAELSLAGVFAEADYRRAVILAYQGMEAFLRRAGLPRAPWETPFEYLDRLFVAYGAPTAVAAALTELYERAKFGHHPIGPEDKAAAVAALSELRDRLREVV